MKPPKASTRQSGQPGQSGPSPALTPEQIDARLEDIAAFNAAARDTLSKHLGDEQWQKLLKQAATQGVDEAQLASLCGKMLRTRTEWHPANPAAALQGACNGLLISLGSTLTEADAQAYEAAVSVTP